MNTQYTDKSQNKGKLVNVKEMKMKKRTCRLTKPTFCIDSTDSFTCEEEENDS